MPPRLRLPRHLPGSFVAHRATAPVLPFLAPALHQQPASRASPLLQTTAIRPQSILSKLSDNPAAYNKRIRRGRGPSSGKGKTSGRGHKGQRQHGKVPAGFEGGQTPIWKVKGLRGFKNVHTPEFNTVPISRILSWVAQGRIDPNKPITVRELALSRCVSNIKDGVKLLATSKYHDLSIDEVPALSQPLNIVVSRASKQAIAAVEAAGGTVLTRYYTNFAIRKIVEGDMDPIYSLQSQLPDGTTPRDRQAAVLQEEQEVEGNDEAWSDRTEQQLLAEAGSAYKYRLPDATSRRDIQYYRDPEHRGYLAYQLKEGENPSLFFKSPEEYATYAKKSEATKKERSKVDTQRLF